MVTISTCLIHAVVSYDCGVVTVSSFDGMEGGLLTRRVRDGERVFGEVVTVSRCLIHIVTISDSQYILSGDSRCISYILLPLFHTCYYGVVTISHIRCLLLIVDISDSKYILSEDSRYTLLPLQHDAYYYHFGRVVTVRRLPIHIFTILVDSQYTLIILFPFFGFFHVLATIGFPYSSSSSSKEPYLYYQ